MAAEVLLQQGVDGGLEHEGVIDGNHADTLMEVPAWLAAAGDAAVHDVVGHQEEGLEELRHPPKSGRLEVFVLIKLLVQEERHGVGYGHASVALPAQRVNVE